MPSGPRLLFTLPGLARNGAVKQTIDIAEGLAARGDFATSFFLFDREEPGARQAFGRSAVVFGHAAPRRSWLAGVPGLWRADRPMLGVQSGIARTRNLAALARAARGADILFSSFESGPALVDVARVARLLRRRFCVIVHNNVFEALPEYQPGWPLERTIRAFLAADHLVFVSRGLRDRMLEHLGPARQAAPPMSVVRNGIDLAALDRMAARGIRIDGVDFEVPAEPYLVSVGRLSAQKGFDLMIAAHAEARRSSPRHLLVIAGPGEDGQRRALLSQAEALGVGDSVRILGHCDNPAGLMRHALGFCMTSRYEGFPLALAEAAALGVPCLAMDCVAGPREILEDGRFGCLTPSGDVGRMAQAMAAHVREPGILRAKAAASFEARERLSLRSCVAGYAEVVGQMLART